MLKKKLPANPQLEMFKTVQEYLI